MKTFVSQLCFGLSMLVLAGCGGDDESPSSTVGAGGTGGGSGGSGGSAGTGGAMDCESPPRESELAIAGAYHDAYGSQRIDDEVWVQGASSFHMLAFSNEERWAIAQNDAGNAYFPGDYSRFDWTVQDGQLHYCQTEYDAASEEEARDAEPADASDLVTGCGASGFSWSLLTPISLVGSTYAEAFEGTYAITPSAWLMGPEVFHLLEFSNDEMWAIAQNDCGNGYGGGLYSRFDWIERDEGGAAGAAGATGAAGAAGAAGANADSSGTYFCLTGYSLESAAAARELRPADEAGCDAFGWTRLTLPD